MRAMIAKKDGAFSVYIAKKDLEEPVVEMERPDLWGGWVRLANGWRLELPPAPPEFRFPITVEVKKLGEDG